MKLRIGILVAVGLFLTACFQAEPKLDASSEERFNESMRAVSDSLNPEIRERFAKSLFAIALNPNGDEKPVLAQLVELANNNDNSSNMIFLRAGAIVDRKTGMQVIALADQRRLENYKRQLSALNDEIETLQEDLDAAKTRAEESERILNAISISGALYYWNNDRYLRSPAIDFNIENNGSFAIKRIFAHGVVETPGRSIPWIDEDFNYEFTGGLEPGESKALSLAPNQFGSWGKAELKDRTDLVMSITLLDLENAAGEKMVNPRGALSVPEIQSNLERKLELKAEVLAKITEVQATLGIQTVN
ncbi:MAG: hypothetical protein CMI60_14645 [Parvibaculum sp.]|jgi:hypothetical protein|nr:hypothetical protein [Parvibaculum sp.]|tara:strand:- start:773 stop:1684 length:912 start_codon:yes stop_codon:yes gene_type:complete